MTVSHVSKQLRRIVCERAGSRCEYCLIAEALTFAAHEIDHIVAVKHSGPTEADNLAFACSMCNSHKDTDLTSIDGSTGEIVRLFHPRSDHWSDHFSIDGGRIEPLTAVGRVTVMLLGMNAPERVAERELHVEAGLLHPDSESEKPH